MYRAGGLEENPYYDTLRAVNLTNLEIRCNRDLTETVNILNGYYRLEKDYFLKKWHIIYRDKLSGHELKL